VRVVSALALVLLLAPVAAAHDLSAGWSSYRLGDGRLATGTQAGPTGGTPPIAWNRSFTIPGDTASPVISNGAVYFGFQDGSTPSSQGSLYAFDLKGGAERWKVRLLNSIGATPVVDGGVVYAVGFDTDATVYALDAQSGATKWEYRLDGQSSSSPLVADGVLYIAANTGSVYALKASNGELLWRAGDSGTASNKNSVSLWDGDLYLSTYSGPQTIGGQGCNKPCSNDYVYAFNEKTGAIDWRADPTDLQSTDDDLISTPVLVDGRLYVVAAHVREYYDDPIKKTGFHAAIPGRLFALEAKSGRVIWKQELADAQWRDPAYVDGLLVAGDNAGDVHVLDAATGSSSCGRCWTKRFDNAVSTPVSVAAGMLYFGTTQKGTCGTYEGNTRGFLHAVALAGGAEAWKIDLGTKMPLNSVAVAQGYLVATARLYLAGTCNPQAPVDLLVIGTDPGTHGANAAPTVTELTPGDGTNAVAPGSPLSWKGADPDASDARVYEVYFGRSDPPPLVAHLQAGERYTPSTVTGENYHWKVVAYDSHGARVASPVLSFSTAGTKTTPPSTGASASGTGSMVGSGESPGHKGFLPGWDPVLFLAAVALALTFRRR
jgi:outer membrane protein assembly factor BamB